MSRFHGPQHKGAMREYRQILRKEAEDRRVQRSITQGEQAIADGTPMVTLESAMAEAESTQAKVKTRRTKKRK